MRVNVYAEEMTDRVEIIEKETKDGKFTGLRIYLELPVTQRSMVGIITDQIKGPFIHRAVLKEIKDGVGHYEIDDDSSAITFWGKRDLLDILYKATDLLEKHYKTERDEVRERLDLLTNEMTFSLYKAAKDVIKDRDVWNSDIFPRKETNKTNDDKIVWESIDKLKEIIDNLDKEA